MSSPTETGTQTQAVSRPEWLPEDFWDTEKNAAKTDAFDEFKSLRELKAQMDARSATLPKEAKDYKLELPADFEGRDQIQLDDTNPLVGIARDFAKEAGVTQEQFNGLVGKFVQQQVEQAKALNAEYTAERAKLGADPDGRSRAATAALEAKIGKDLIPYVTGEKRGAGLIMAIEKLLSPGGAPFVAGGASAPEPGTIPGYANMTFQQRMAAADAIARQKTGR